jgi:hypothetical protein
MIQAISGSVPRKKPELKALFQPDPGREMPQ